MRTDLTAIAAFAAAVASWGCPGEEEQPAEEPVVFEVSKGDLVFAGSYYGDLKAKESVEIYAPELKSTRTMTVDTVLEDGTHVEEGDVLLTFVKENLVEELRGEEEKLRVSEAEKRRTEHLLAKEKIDLELEVRRRRMMVERARLQVVEGANLVSKVDLEKAKLDVQKAELELELSEKALEAFAGKRRTALEVERIKVQTQRRKVEEKKSDLALMEIVAPASGVLYRPYSRLNWNRGVKVAPGRVVSRRDKVLEIPDLSAYEAEVYIRQRDATMIRKGAAAEVIAPVLPERKISGCVTRKDSFATTRNERLSTKTPEGSLKELLVVVELDEAPPELRPGGGARVSIESTLATDVLVVPLAAVREESGRQTVLLEDGETRAVRLGRSTTSHAEVLEGLSPGNRVVLR